MYLLRYQDFDAWWGNQNLEVKNCFKKIFYLKATDILSENIYVTKSFKELILVFVRTKKILFIWIKISSSKCAFLEFNL